MRTREVISYIVNWLENYVTDSTMNGFVVGVSGGIDSAVTSTLVALTKKPVLVVEMPIYQSIEQVSRAKEHMDFLVSKYPNVSETRVDLTKTFDSLKAALGLDESQKNAELSLANSRARLRMTALYYFAGLNRYLVAGTGNKVEDFGVGFYTKYGDGGVDISPIAGLMKTQVYEIAKELGVAQSIQIAKPTDGLWGDNRTDEDQIGATYPELEWAMNVHETHSAEDFSGRQKEVFQIYDRLNKVAQHKMKPIPVCEIPEELLK